MARTQDPKTGPGPKRTTWSHSHRNLLSFAIVSRRVAAEWPTLRDLWSEGSQVHSISVPFKSNLIGVGCGCRSCEGGRKRGSGDEGVDLKVVKCSFHLGMSPGGLVGGQKPLHPTLSLFSAYLFSVYENDEHSPGTRSKCRSCLICFQGSVLLSG